jgi:hypothetical protein
MERLRKAKNLLEAVLENRAALQWALDHWPEAAGGAEGNMLENARWHLVYILNDEDIIERDSEYGEYMQGELIRIRDQIGERLAKENPRP